MADDTNGHQGHRRPLSRRRALQLAAGGSLVGLAGCASVLDSGENSTSGNGNNDGGGGGGSGGNGNNGGGGNGNSGGNDGSNQSGGAGSDGMVDATYVTYESTKPSDLQFNPYSTAPTEWDVQSAAQLWMLDRTRDGQAVFGINAKDWSIENEEVTVTLADTFKWPNGDPVTAKDWQFKYDFQRYMAEGDKNALSPLVDGVKATDTYTLKYDLNQTVNKEVAVEFLRDFLVVHPPTFQKYMDKFDDAPNDDARSKVITEVSEFSWEEPTFAGPLQWVDKNAQELHLKVRDKYPFEDVQKRVSKTVDADVSNWGRPNFNDVTFLWATDDNNVNQLINSGRVDGGRGTSLLSGKNPSIPGKYDVHQVPAGYGWGLDFNFWQQGQTQGLEDFLDMNVRRAFAHAIDRDAVGKQLQQSPDPVLDPVITGMTQAQEDNWLDDSIVNRMQKYDFDHDKAAKLLHQSDYTKQNGTWKKPNGDTFSVTFKTASSVNAYVSALQVATANLKQFGIDAQLLTEDGTSFFSAQPPDQGYQMTVGFYGGAWPFPYFAYDFTYNRPSYEPPGGGDTDYLLPGNTVSEETMKVPPVGKPDSSKRIEINPHEKMDALSKATNRNQQKQIVTELAWTTNQWVPKLCCVEASLAELFNPSEWNYPTTKNSLMTAYPSRSFVWQLGLVDAKQ